MEGNKAEKEPTARHYRPWYIMFRTIDFLVQLVHRVKREVKIGAWCQIRENLVNPVENARAL